MRASITVDDGEIRGALQGVIALGRDASPLMRKIAALGAAATRARFRAGRGPDGEKWEPSERVWKEGGRTLVDSGHLRDSISRRFSRAHAEFHQFGGRILPKRGKALKFRTPGGGFAVVRQVRLPARPFLGISKEDKANILDIIESHIAQATGGAAHAL
jgi:phage virion morphogenesis protein